MRHLAIFLIGLTMTAPAAPAQPPVSVPSPAPDPAALDLARLLMSRDPSLYDDAEIGRFRTRLEAALLASEGACNPFVTACQAAAAGVAAEFAPALRQSHRERSERLTAAELSASLRPEEMTRIAAWLRSAEGGRFLDAWASLRDPESAARRRRALQSDPARTAPTVFNPARASFRQRTRNLPQPAPR